MARLGFFARGLVVACGMLASVPLGAAAPPHPANWINYVSLAPDGGHILGNPAAKVKLVEYMSYTCPHCAAFEMDGIPTLRLTAVAGGKVSVEIRHLLRDPVDATVAQLTNCGAPQQFFALHDDFLRKQEHWVGEAQHVTAGQSQRWYSGTRLARMRAIASDLGFYTIMESHGIERIAADRCLADENIARRNVGETEAATKLGATGTPAFVLDGILLAGTYEWRELEPQIAARL